MPTSGRPLDPRITAAVRALRSAGGSYPTSRDLARTVGLSASRLRHLFAEQIGMSFRRYTLWLRLNAVLDELLEGASLTTGAHAAGFADSAHLSRTFRRMFGIVPGPRKPESDYRSNVLARARSTKARTFGARYRLEAKTACTGIDGPVHPGRTSTSRRLRT